MPSPKNSILLFNKIGLIKSLCVAAKILVAASDRCLTAFNNANALASGVALLLTKASAKFNNTSAYLISGIKSVKGLPTLYLSRYFFDVDVLVNT